MNDLNSVILIGRITRDAEVSYTANGSAISNLSIAVNRSKKNGDTWVDEVSFFDVEVWGKIAESLKPYLTKGKQISVRGYLKQDRWEKDGVKGSRVKIVSEELQLIGGTNQNQANPNPQASAPAFKPNPNPMPSNNAFPEDMPF